MAVRSRVKRMILRACGTLRADLLLDRARAGSSSVLMYHYFTAGSAREDPLVMPVERFREQMLDLVRRYRPTPLSEAVAAARAGRSLPRRSVVITVEDVGPDFLEHAWPVLETLSIPVCLAIVTGFADPAARAERLFGIAHAFVRSDPGSAARLSRALRLASLSYRECFEHLHGMGADRLAEALGRAGLPTECDGMLPGSVRLPLLDFPRLARIAGSGLVEIASHSVTHPDLRLVSEPWLRWELETSRRTIEERFGKCPGFFYPGGSVPPGDGVGSAAVRRAGYEYACVVMPGLLGRRSDLNAIRRIAVDGTEPMSVFRLRAAGFTALFRAGTGSMR